MRKTGKMVKDCVDCENMVVNLASTIPGLKGKSINCTPKQVLLGSKFIYGNSVAKCKKHMIMDSKDNKDKIFKLSSIRGNSTRGNGDRRTFMTWLNVAGTCPYYESMDDEIEG